MHRLITLFGAAIAGLASIFRTPSLALANIGEGTHEGSIPRKTDAAIATRHLLYKVGSDADHIAACGASDLPIGPVADEASAAEALVAVDLLGIKNRTMLMVISEAIDAGEKVFTAANGKIQDLPTAAGTYYCVGTALKSGTTDGDVIEVAHCNPVTTVVA